MSHVLLMFTMLGLLMLPALSAASAASELTVINSLGPVLLNETVASIVPNFHPGASGAAVTVKLLGAATDTPPRVLRQAAGIVHWLNGAAALDQIEYTLCVGARSGSQGC
jgi:hypothetical protein